MSDLDQWKVHGPVRTLRSEFATWDLDLQDWKAARHFNMASFRVDGAILGLEAHNADGSIAHSQWLYDDAGRLIETNFWSDEEPVNRTMYLYDDSGRHLRTTHLGGDGVARDIEDSKYDADGQKTKVRFLSLPNSESTVASESSLIAHTGYSIEGTDSAYGAPGATTMTTTYDEGNLPAQVDFHDVNERLLSSVTFLRNDEGRVLREEMRKGEKSPFQEFLDRASPEEREQLAAVFDAVLGDTVWSATYEYDAQGRRATREHRLGTLGGDFTIYRYENHDEPVEETTTYHSREGSLDETGGLHYSSAQVRVQHNRIEYIYDALDNWTERTVSSRSEAEPNFRYSNRERRVLTYYSAEEKTRIA